MKNTEFEKYFNQHYNEAVGYTIKKVNDIDVAEDIVMNSFYSCYSKFDTFDPDKASFSTWFYFVLNNKIKNHYRDQKNHDDIDDLVFATEGFEDELLKAIELSKIRSTLKLALENLSDVQRRIVILKYFQSKDAAEISILLGMSHGNVRIQLMRSIKKMRSVFEDNGIEWEG
jgi:RNA polymerase sigma-70 factor (ECF subfamily)